MDQKIIDFNKTIRINKFPELRAGDVVEVHKRIKEGEKERIQVFKGMIIAIKGMQSSSPMVTVRKESHGVGVEITIPLFLPTIEKIVLVRHSKVRRSKLYYMRGRSGKAAKMKVRELTNVEKQTIKGIEDTFKEKKAAKEEVTTEAK